MSIGQVRDNSERSRWELHEEGNLVGIADYVVRDDVVVITHTEIHPSRRGKGLAEHLVRHALDDVRAAGRRVEPRCWYVAEFLDANDDYADLRPG
ncbi:MAG: GNAT family N-acetyltransferase [Actinomycetota bacterium]|nr:GNAT family N-acetyltransferase [Actinomycetota bacterium]